jgi:hypothetical protein
MILVAGRVLIVVGVFLIGWMLTTKDEKDAIKIKLENGKTDSLTFEYLTLVPGEECEYVIQFEKTSASKCTLELDFVDTDEEKTLKNYARVKMLANGEVICDELLADAFEQEKMTLSVDFDKGENTKLKVIYYLPIDVGNEAKRAEAVFELLITAIDK